MKKFLLIIFFTLITFELSAEIKNKIIQSLEQINNVSFKFEQNINGKIENGNCTIEYPKKIFCNYDLINKKILVSNGRSLVIKTINSYYIYPLEKTPLNLILDKNFLINRVKVLEEKILDKNLINFKFVEENTEINVFFDNKTFELIGWQNIDLYQNFNITFLSPTSKNRILPKNLFKLPVQN